ncbi:MAG TPA: UDP-2,3-diacylglucosamine diphosphatase [Candidatus Saccharimonadales bacterium]|nr:UDP-2,3-diacylglucosamine diphosphatase [Candidatus Saccharimonadales bacterium]
MRPLIFVADAHLTREDPEVDAFVSFIRSVGPGASAIGILGDLFNLWFGHRKFALPHHRRVLDALEDVRSRGVRLFYVEGNRDFHLKRTHLGRPFGEITETSLVEIHDGWRIHATHGDAINEDDRQYRLWKAFSKSAPVYGVFGLLPGRAGMRLGERLERKLSGTNIRNKSRFPMEHCVSYGRRALESGCDAVVMGHFHEERFVPLGGTESRPRGVWVLPAFRHSHRYLVFDGPGPPSFESFGS